MKIKPQKPTKKDLGVAGWLILAGLSSGFILNMLTDRGINIMKALGL